MKKHLKFVGCVTGLCCVLGLVSCGQNSSQAPTAEESKKFQGGGTMTPAEAAAAKVPAGPPPAPAQNAR